jgi:neopullulanase
MAPRDRPFLELPGHAVSLPVETPDWVRDAIFYQVFPDRFARSRSVPKPANLQPWGSTPTYHGYMGGDLVGVCEQLEYLTDLGVNALYFTPVFQSASNHRYHTHDYEKVDRMLGGNDALRRLIDEAHALGIRIVLDGVFNHASRGFFPFHDILENGPDSAYLDWFHVRAFPLNAYTPERPLNYESWWNLPALPKFNIRTEAVRQFLWGIGRRWVEFGIDGWRLDVPNEIDDDSFWREFRRQVKGVNPQAYIVGEVWQDAPRWLQGDMWDAVMNYQFTRACIAYFIDDHVDESLLKKTSLYPAGATGAAAFSAALDRLLALYDANVSAVMLNLLDSHDMARFVTLARGDLAALRLATTFQMTYIGAPSIYYGDEIGMAGGHDPLNRAAFPWERDAWNTDLLHEFQRLIALRRSSAALRRGSYTSLLAAGGVFAFARRQDREAVVVALNTEDRFRRLDLPVREQLAEGSILAEVWGSATARVESGALRGVELTARSARLLRTTDTAPAPGRPGWP